MCEVAIRSELKEARRRRREAALALRPEMSPAGPAPEHFRVATWNVNSLKARTPALRRFLERTAPDVVLLQETKASEVAPVAVEVFDEFGYGVVHSGAGGYNGVAIAARHPIGDVVVSADFADEHLGREPRLIAAVIEGPETIRCASVYVPHGREVGHWHYEYKLAFLAALRDQVAEWLADGPLVLGGDFNVAPTDSDIFHPDAFVGLTHVTPPERRGAGGRARRRTRRPRRPPVGPTGASLHVVEPRAQLLAQPRHADRPVGGRPRSRRSVGHDVDRPCRAWRRAPVGSRRADRRPGARARTTRRCPTQSGPVDAAHDRSGSTCCPPINRASGSPMSARRSPIVRIVQRSGHRSGSSSSSQWIGTEPVRREPGARWARTDRDM